MSLDYSTRQVVRVNVPRDGAVANATTVLNGSTVFSYDKYYAIIGIMIYVKAAATLASQTIRLQLSDSAGSFSSPTTLAEQIITSSHTAGTKFWVPVSVASCDLASGYVARLVDIATGTDATANFDVDIVATVRDC